MKQHPSVDSIKSSENSVDSISSTEVASKFRHTETGKYVSLLMKLGATMTTSIGLCFAVGLILIKQFQLHTSILVFFTFLGVACGFYFIYKAIQKL